MGKVVLGMSGGVDSSMAVALLQEEGHEVIGVTFNMFGNSNDERASHVARKFSIEHHHVNVAKVFKEKVIGHFINEYAGGRTPSPCVYCNHTIKFPMLLEMAGSFGADKIATGHYVNITQKNNHYYISKGADLKKDQSYYLWKLNESVLEKTIFPLGNENKDDIKQLAMDLGFDSLAKQHESMGVCFLRKTDYRTFLKEEANDLFNKIEKGEVLNNENKIIGSHDGYPYYTIGQKSGLNLNRKGYNYVAGIDKKLNRIYVDVKDALYVDGFEIDDCHFQNTEDIELANITVKVRGLGINPKGYCTIVMVNEKRAKISLENPAWALAPGQPVVFYIEDRVIGGGYMK